MRLGTKLSDDFLQILNKKNNEIQEQFLNHIKNLTKTTSIKVMLGDSTITQQLTFDQTKIKKFFENFIKKLEDWSVQEVSTSNNEDLRRLFIKFQVREGNYLLSGHFSIQFHVLLYYKPEYRVIECQKELSEILDSTKDKESEIKNFGDEFIINKLKGMGYKDLDHQGLFELFFNDDALQDKIYKEIEEKYDIDFQKVSKKKAMLFNELDGYLIETYQSVPILIDDARLVTGEEGCLCTFDLEFIKNKNKEGLFNTKKIPNIVKQKINARLDQILNLLKF
ncbi:MAG: hypothetical protein NPMRTH4_1890004 [Nitrosopumilales archaeon]|nr:MAG: hypothetical protein NPMRTH4_1890004 [Nitrosopumilales archaeon]